ncbi:hypothetical protein K3176_07840 [Pseudomonas aeruginosa]|uniref:hypothetical protein n=1 Tax=Pseudomonas aeruginosa TaxID=287 RepID=UPI001C8457AE|nr:hypothetical protein [Pseudomonas aeruginosa]QZD62358.1 hypothetical protein K3176_23225 [Pseudomonas aeruginosa]QZD65939.1 hypothetical protein K3176_07840 [Pseudomonas aeruginosa]
MLLLMLQDVDGAMALGSDPAIQLGLGEVALGFDDRSVVLGVLRGDGQLTDGQVWSLMSNSCE